MEEDNNTNYPVDIYPSNGVFFSNNICKYTDDTYYPTFNQFYPGSNYVAQAMADLSPRLDLSQDFTDNKTIIQTFRSSDFIATDEKEGHILFKSLTLIIQNRCMMPYILSTYAREISSISETYQRDRLFIDGADPIAHNVICYVIVAPSGGLSTDLQLALREQRARVHDMFPISSDVSDVIKLYNISMRTDDQLYLYFTYKSYTGLLKEMFSNLSVPVDQVKNTLNVSILADVEIIPNENTSN